MVAMKGTILQLHVSLAKIMRGLDLQMQYKNY
jgi:hypothetical protein